MTGITGSGYWKLKARLIVSGLWGDGIRRSKSLYTFVLVVDPTLMSQKSIMGCISMCNMESHMDETSTIPRSSDINDLLAKVKDIPPLPNIVSRAMEIAYDPNDSVRDLQILILKDRELSAKMLRIVNSAIFALRSEDSTVPHAVSVLGIDKDALDILASETRMTIEATSKMGN